MALTDPLRAHLARRLERGDPSLAARTASTIWGAFAARGLARPLRLPEGLQVIGVGSAVMGGAGKTPLARSLGLDLEARGLRVAIVGHAYRAHPGRARIVQCTDLPREVGDDALAIARALDGSGVSVIVAPTRQSALDFAASRDARVVIVDGLLQAAPHRLAMSILVLDAGTPWGALACPPAGDLRAPREALLAASDRGVVINASGTKLPTWAPSQAIVVPSAIKGTIAPDGSRRTLDDLQGLRLGVLLTVARPARIIMALREAGLVPAHIITLADHAMPSARDLDEARRAHVDLWLTTTRCAVKLPAGLGAAPVLTLDHQLDVSALAPAIIQQFA